MLEISVKQQENGIWLADCVNLPGMPPVGRGKSYQDAIGSLVVGLAANSTYQKYHNISVNIKHAKNISPPHPFILFIGQTYYPDPGWNGYVGDFETLDEAINTGKQKCDGEFNWWQVVDLNQKVIVAGEGQGHTGLFGKVSVGP